MEKCLEPVKLTLAVCVRRSRMDIFTNEEKFFGEKTRTMGRKPFEGVCITWQKREKEKKGRQECYAMQMTPKEVLMDQWHGRKQKYVVAKRRNIKYLRRKGRFPIKLRNE